MDRAENTDNGESMNSRNETKTKNCLTSAMIATVAALVLAPMTGADARPESHRCFSVRGEFDEHAVGPPSCVSPVNFCFGGTYSGNISGPFSGFAITLTAAADPEVSNVMLFNSRSQIQARVRGLEGTLTIRNAGSFETDGEGNIVDLQSIIGGTGALTGASGSLRASGFFDPVTASGTSSYEGTVCLPTN